MLQKAIKGFVVMSEELDRVYTAFINNQVCSLNFLFTPHTNVNHTHITERERLMGRGGFKVYAEPAAKTMS